LALCTHGNTRGSDEEETLMIKRLTFGVLVGVLLGYVLSRRSRSAALEAEATSRADDAALTQEVEAEIFRDSGVPKEKVVVNAENGVVYLRGEVPEQSMLDALVATAREVRGVRAVESFLRLAAAET
jgi:osmotically-inducible protein OsmY